MNAAMLWILHENVPAENKWNLIKQYRNELLARSYWTQLPDAILTATEKTEWQMYRESLQKIEFSFSLPDDVIFPDPPSVISTPQTISIVQMRARKFQASKNARAIPSWATWTQAEAEAWASTNIATPLANARTSLPATLTLATARAAFVVLFNILDKMRQLQKANAQMTLALRDEIWPDLQDR